MPEEDEEVNPFLKRREELVKSARLERKRVDAEAEQERQRLYKEAEQERQRLAQLRKEMLSNAKKYLVEDIDLVLENLAKNPLILEKAGSKSFTSEAFENFRHEDTPIYHETSGLIITLDADGIIAIRELATNNILKQIDTSNDNVLSKSSIISLVISYDCRFIAIASNEETQIWDVDYGKKINTFEGYSHPIAFFADSYDILTTAKSYGFVIFSAITGHKYTDIPHEETSSLSKISLSKVLAEHIIYFIKGESVSSYSLSETYDVLSEGLKSYQKQILVDPKPKVLLRKHLIPEKLKSNTTSYGYILNGELYIEASTKHNGNIAKKYSQNHELKRYYAYESFSFHPNEELVAVCTAGKEIFIWDMITKTQIQAYRHSVHGTNLNVDFSNCGKFIVVSANTYEGNGFCHCKVLDYQTGEPVSELKSVIRPICPPSTYGAFNDDDLQSIFVNVKDDLREADFILDTVDLDGINYSLSWSGL